jgi:bifunctional non-homologous end joining protein LigD
MSSARKRAAATVLDRRKPDAMPAFVPPCLATLTSVPPSGDVWVHEIKFDGYRMQARIADGKVKLLTRTGLDWTARFLSVAKALANLKLKSAIIDGEVIVQDETGASSFVRLVEALDAGRSAEMQYMAFDLVYLDGVDLRTAPLLERKELLSALLKRTR